MRKKEKKGICKWGIGDKGIGKWRKEETRYREVGKGGKRIGKWERGEKTDR